MTPRRLSATSVAIVVVMLATLLGALTPTLAGASRAARAATAQREPDPPTGQGLSAAVSKVPASSSELDAAEAARDKLLDRQTKASDELARTLVEISSVDAERAALGQLIARRAEQITKADALHAQLRTDLRAIASEWFITGFGVGARLDPTLSAEERSALNHAKVLSEAAAADTIADEHHAAGHLTSLRSESDSMTARLVTLDEHSAELATRRDRLSAELVALANDLIVNEARVAEARMTASIDGTDLSTGALDAYWRAAQALAILEPRCRVPWWALAGIGRTESRHGTYLGADLGRDGQVTPPIYGPELDGSNTFAVVADSDGGALDGTSTTDRAVGPMQFLPSTWRSVGSDGTGDGVADPQNLYDAAVSAGVYLCKSGPDLDQDANLRTAYFSYNHSLPYVDIVMGYATGYDRSVPIG